MKLIELTCAQTDKKVTYNADIWSLFMKITSFDKEAAKHKLTNPETVIVLANGTQVVVQESYEKIQDLLKQPIVRNLQS